MYKFLPAGILIIFFFFSFSQTGVYKNYPGSLKAYLSADNLYRKATTLSDNAGNNEQQIAVADDIYVQALTAFHQLIPGLKESRFDSLFILSSTKAGIIHQYFDSTQLARKFYLNAIHARQTSSGIEDSVFFQPLLFTGSICYTYGEYDSAFYYLKQAEAIKSNYSTPLLEEQRLYNLLGVLHYETGNLKQSKNYIEKAIATTLANNLADRELKTNYQLNITSILIKLQEYEEAERILKEISSTNIYPDEINHALGFVCLKTLRYKEAIGYFGKVNYTKSKRIVDLMLNTSAAYKGLSNTDSCNLYLLKAKTENLKWNGSRKSVSQGIIFKQEAEEQERLGQYKNALSLYQQSILQLSNTFTDSSPTKNPETFSGTFAYIDLFTILTAKAEVFKKLYDTEKDIQFLESALQTYLAAFKLADYVEKTYDSDEARLFIGKIKHTVHNKPIAISLQLYELTQKKQFLEEAYFFDQRNKASILSFNAQVNEFKKLPGKHSGLVEKEQSLKSAITRLSLSIAATTDTITLQKLYASIRDNEIALGQLQEQLNADPAWQQKSMVEKIPSVNELQKKLDPSTAILSFHLSENELLLLLISANQFDYTRTEVNNSFFTDIESLKSSLQNSLPDTRYTGKIAAARLFQKLILPLQTSLQQKKRLIIIPDDELNHLPFEALQDANDTYLIEKFSVQYQFSTALSVSAKKERTSSSLLAFAPFATGRYEDVNGELFTNLPASNAETNVLKGTILTDSAATKLKFLQLASSSSVIHLATHAVLNNKDPMRSFIAFYPDTTDFKLYAREIYDLNLDSLQLIILSACETGSGQLVKGEGLMSLSRAFAYAGCSNIITSLWKAEDRATAFITNRLHYYLEKEYTKDHALQKAKLDLLTSTEIDPRLKSPNYWAHLILIGDYETEHQSKNWWWIALFIIAGAGLYKLAGRKKPR
jgi:CHAT domain-containing protein